MAVAIGKIGEFDESKETFTTYVKRLKLYFSANNVSAGKQSEYFCLLMGSKTFQILTNLTVPDDPTTYTFADIEKTLEQYFSPRKIQIIERFHFNKRNQKENETVAEYALELKRLANTCDFGDFLYDALRDRLVCGLKSERIQQKLLAETKILKFNDALTLASVMELADKEMQGMQPTEAANTNWVKKKYNKDSSTEKKMAEVKKTKCVCCGKVHKSKCKYSEYVCHNCGIKGHLSQVCKNKKKIKCIEGEDTDNTEEETVDFLSIYSAMDGEQNPFNVTMKIANNKVAMEVDTGASVSVVTYEHYKKYFANIELSNTEAKLYTFSGEPLNVLGKIVVPVEFNNLNMKLPLVIVKCNSGIKLPMLCGRNWLKRLNIKFNLVNNISDSYNFVDVQDIIHRLELEFKDVFNMKLGTFRGPKVHVNLKGNPTPVFCKPRNIPYSLKGAVKEELQRLAKEDVLYPVVSSEWATPIVVVEKGNGKIRICGDYKSTINPVSTVEHYPLPNVNDIFAQLKAGNVFTVIDLSNAYQQVLLSDETQKLLTINTYLGLFRYRRMPFGITSAPAIFQSLMDNILKDLENVVCYIDDILIVTKTLDENVSKVKEVLNRLAATGISIKKEKCKFFEQSVVYLGHEISKNGFKPTNQGVEAVVQAPAPTNVTMLKAFLGLINFHSKYLPNLSSILRPLYDLLEANKKWCWNRESQQSFDKCKQMLTDSRTLTFYDTNKELILTCDSSAYGVGAILSHVMENGEEKPVLYASRTLSKAEKNYPQLEKEALAIIFGIKKFHSYLYGREFTLYTDHKPLVTILGPNKAIPSLAAARLQRWALILSAYKYNIKYKPGVEICNADGLSRLPLATDSEEEVVFYFSPINALPMSWIDISKWTSKDPILSQVLDKTLQGWSKNDNKPELLPYFRRCTELSVDKGCILWGRRVIIPSELRPEVLKLLHEQHPGIVKTKSIARSLVWWDSIDKDIEIEIGSCAVCQATQNNKQEEPLHNWPWTTRVFERVHIDFAEKDNQSFLILIDTYSKWLEIRHMKTITAQSTITALRSIFAAYGLPENLVSDNGPQLVSSEFETFCTQNCINHLVIPPYHPKSNGAAERAVQEMKKALLKLKLEDQTKNEVRSVQHKLDNLLFAYRNTPTTTTGRTPAEIFLKRTPRTRLSILKPTAQIKQKKDRTDDDKLKTTSFQINDLVYVKSVRGEEIKWFSGIIIKAKSPVTYLVKVGPVTRFVHADHLKHRYGKGTEIIGSSEKPKGEGTGEELVTQQQLEKLARLAEQTEQWGTTEQTPITESHVTFNPEPNPTSPVKPDALSVRKSTRIKKPVIKMNL